MQVLWRKLNSGMWFLTVLGRKNTRFFARSSLGIKEFIFHYVRTIIPMFALQTRAAYLLLDCPPDTLRCALTASQSSVGGTQIKERHPSDASPYYIRMRMRGITMLYPAFSGRICNATERSPERRRRVRLPLSGTVLLQKRNMKRNRRTEIASGGRYEE